MKNILLILLGVCAVGAARAEIVFRAEPPQTPEKAPIIALARWPMSHATFQRRALEFGVRGQTLKSPRGLVSKSGSLLFQKDPLGTEFFADTDRYMASPPGEMHPIPDTTAISLAGDFLRKHPGGVNLDEARLLRVSHMFNQGEDLEKGIRTPITQDESIVIYQRVIGGLPVVPAGGSGDHLRVHIANNGDVVGQHQVWRNARSTVELLPARPYAEARRELVENLSRELGANQQYDGIITKIEFGLFSRPEGQPQGFFQPAWLFTVELYDREEKQTTGARLVALPGVDPRALREPLELPLPPPQTGDREKIVFHAQPPQLPAALPAVQIKPDEINGEELRRRAGHLGLENGQLIEAPRGLGLTDKRLLLFQNPQGTELFSDTERMMAEPPGEGAPIPDRDAIAIARGYLKNLGDVNPDELGEPIVRRLRQQTFDTKGQKAGPETQDEAIVEFPRLILVPNMPPIPSVGPVSALNVHVDNGGVVTGHHRVWRKLNMQAVEPLELRKIGPIQEEFVRHLLSDLGQSVAIVTDIKAGLYMRAEGLDQGYAQPAVLYDVDIVDETTGEVTAHRQIPIPAANTLMEPLDDPDAQPGVTDPGLQDDRANDAIPLLFGDMDNDGELKLDDVVLCLQVAGGLSEPDTERQFVAGDVVPNTNPLGDDHIMLTDALRILRGVFGLDDLDPA